MSFQTIAIGVCHAEPGISSPRAVVLEAVPGANRDRLNPTILDCIAESASAISAVSDGALRTDPSNWGLVSSVPLELLEGRSFGLSIFVSMYASLIGCGTRRDIACTGRIAPDGSVAAVRDIRLKAEVAATMGYLVLPAGNDPGEEIVVRGTRILHAAHVDDVLWLLLGTGYLETLVDRIPEDAWGAVEHYLDRCRENAAVPEGLGPVIRRAFVTPGSLLAETVQAHRHEWEERVLALAPISEPDPSDLLQALFPEVSWETLQRDNPPKAEALLIDLAKSLVLRGRVVLAKDLINLVLLGRAGPTVLIEDGGLRRFVDWLYERFQSRGDNRSFGEFFLGPTGILRRIQAEGVMDEELKRHLVESELETEVIHDLKDGRTELGRFLYRLGGEALDFSIEKPMALLDSSGTVPPFLRRPDWTPAMDATLASPEGRLMCDRFSPQIFHLNRFGTRLMWADGLGCWPPSIDSIHFLADLYDHQLHLLDDPSARVLDLCCGCGVIGIALAKVGDFQNITFLDLEPNACTTTRINLSLNFPVEKEPWQEVESAPSRAHRLLGADEFGMPREFWVLQGEATQTLTAMAKEVAEHGPRFDRAFFTPPYVPEPDLLGVPMWRATAGTALLEWCIENGAKYCRELLVAYSRMAEAAVRRGLLRGADTVTSEEIIGRHWVAVRIPGFVDAFDVNREGKRVGELPLRAERYWKMYLDSSLRRTEELAAEGLCAEDGHGFGYAQEIVTHRIVYR